MSNLLCYREERKKELIPDPLLTFLLKRKKKSYSSSQTKNHTLALQGEKEKKEINHVPGESRERLAPRARKGGATVVTPSLQEK